MRIAIDARKADDFGIGTYLRGLLDGLHEVDPGIDLILIAREGVRDLDRYGTLVHARSGGYTIGEMFEIGRLAEESGADLLHVPHYVIPFCSLPTTSTVHDLIHLRLGWRQLSPIARGYARFMIARAVRKSRAIFTPTEAVRKEIVLRWSGAADRTFVTHNAVSSRFREVEAGRLPEQLEGNSRFILFVGNDKPHKNVDRLVEAWSSIRPEFPDLNLALVGGDFSDRGPGVVATGKVDLPTLRALYERAEALVQPSTMEGFGLPVIEAMWCGTPVAISSIPALREVAGSEAVSFDPRSVEEIASAISRLLTDEELAAAERRRGPDRARQFSWAASARVAADQWRSILRDEAWMDRG